MRSAIADVLTQVLALQGESATYTPAGGGGTTVNIFPVVEDDQIGVGQAQVFAETFVFDVLVAEVASPAAGDTLVWNGTTYVIDGQPAYKDRLKLIWTLTTHIQGT